MHLEGITGDLIDAKKQKTHLVATRGLFDNKANILELYDSIDVTGDGGLNAKLTHATIKTKEGIITSDQPSTIIMGAGRITSNQLTIRQKTKEYTFVDNVQDAHEAEGISRPLPHDQARKAAALRQAGRAGRRRLEPPRHRRRARRRRCSRAASSRPKPAPR